MGVTCPFTGQTNLPFPSEGFWAPHVPGQDRMWYFHHSEVQDEGMVECLMHLMDEAMDHNAVTACIEPMIDRGDLVKVGEWWFVRLPPKPPKFYNLETPHLVRAITQGDKGLDELRAEAWKAYEEYVQALEKAFKAALSRTS